MMYSIQITKINCFSKMVNRMICQNMRSENSCCRKTLLTITISRALVLSLPY